LDFPIGYQINDEFEASGKYLGNRFLIEHWDDGKIEEKFKEIINHLKIEL